MSKKNEQIVMYWMEQIKYAVQYKKKFTNQASWADYRNYYRGKWLDDVLPLNVTFSAGRTIVPRAYFRNPRVIVQPKHPRYEFPARIVEAIDNWLIKETLLKQTLRGGVLHTFCNGTGPIKLGYDSEFGYLPDQGRDGETFTDIGKSDPRRIEYNTAIKPGTPWALPELPDNVIVPFGYKYPNQLPWVAHRIYRPLEDVLQDSKYKMDKGKPLQGTRSSNLDMPRPPGFMGREGELAVCELFEIRDASNRTILTICEDQLLLSDHDALQIEGLPWEFIIFNEDPEHFWGIEDVKMIEPQQLEMNEIKSQIQAHRAIALLKFIALRGAMKPFDIKGLLSGDVGPYVEVDGEAVEQVIKLMQPHIPPDLFTAAREVAADIQETLRISANQMAAFKAGTPPTAQETSEVSGSHAEDVDDRRDIVGDVLINIVRKWNQMIFSEWTTEKVIRLVGPMGAQWVKYTGEQIRGEYDLTVDLDTGFKVSRQVRMQAADKLFAQFGGDDTMNTQELKRMVLREFEWIFPGVSRILKDLPPAIADAMSATRQPHPQGSGGQGPSSQGNRGGGRQAGNVQSFEEAKQTMQKGGQNASK